MMPQAFLILLIFLIAVLEGVFGISALWVSGAAAVMSALSSGWRVGVFAVISILAGSLVSGVPLMASLVQSFAISGAILTVQGLPAYDHDWSDEWRTLALRAFRTIVIPSSLSSLVLLIALPPSDAFEMAIALGTGMSCFAPAIYFAGDRVESGPALLSSVLSAAVMASAIALQLPWAASFIGIASIALLAVFLTIPTTLWSLLGMALGANVSLVVLNPEFSEAISLTFLSMSVLAVLICARISKLRSALLDSQDKAERRTARIRYLLQDRDEVTALAVHDLQSPIQAIGGLQKTLLYMVETGQTDVDQIRPALQVAIETSNDLSDRVASVLNEKRPHLGGQGEGALAGVIINHTVASHRLDLDKKALQIDRDVRSSFSVEQAEDVKDVLDVLLDNAIRHSPAGGMIVLSADQDDTSNTLTFDVSDEGSGLNNETAQCLFESPARPEQKTRQGMGLFLAYRRARSMGGRLTYRPTTTGGACFSLVLPQKS